MFGQLKTMTTGEFLVFFNALELVKLLQLNKASHYLMREIVNFEVLFKTQGIILSTDEVKTVQISTAIALQLAAKRMILNSIIKSPRIIGYNLIREVTSKV